MVLAVTAFLASALDTSAAAAMPTGRLPEVFVAACLEGKVSLSAGEAGAVAFDELPSALRKRLGSPSSGQAWRLNSFGNSYLYVLNYPSRPGIDPKICGLASDRMTFNAAAEALEMRIFGQIYPERGEGLQWLMAQDGYIATATTAGEFNVVQINWLSEAGRAAIERNLRPFTR